VPRPVHRLLSLQRARSLDGVHGAGRGELVRLYFARIGPPAHLFIAGVDTPNEGVFAKLTKVATKTLASLHLPAKLPSRQGR